jgi:hypothetical protein
MLRHKLERDARLSQNLLASFVKRQYMQTDYAFDTARLQSFMQPFFEERSISLRWNDDHRRRKWIGSAEVDDLIDEDRGLSTSIWTNY